jgi:hypothetical protein
MMPFIRSWSYAALRAIIFVSLRFQTKSTRRVKSEKISSTQSLSNEIDTLIPRQETRVDPLLNGVLQDSGRLSSYKNCPQDSSIYAPHSYGSNESKYVGACSRNGARASRCV